ncbi:hypothetical protein STAN_5264 [Streptomyces sp. CBMAI 2042]|nr:hypothetical protein STAN_5264 [Streptomyces sp. CBMAI 2042]
MCSRAGPLLSRFFSRLQCHPPQRGSRPNSAWRLWFQYQPRARQVPRHHHQIRPSLLSRQVDTRLSSRRSRLPACRASVPFPSLPPCLARRQGRARHRHSRAERLSGRRLLHLESLQPLPTSWPAFLEPRCHRVQRLCDRVRPHLSLRRPDSRRLPLSASTPLHCLG